ncbi:ABC transporter ATP-binding protein [Hyphococcus sp. DH-69]|uniref:ABC transporter ATP-binding protein n=1 Tax=Hyphococcus formosus TaxID=3143534 RepID=UPI00398B7FA1
MSLILRDISHRFGDVRAVRGASLEIRPGEIVCLFGHSGCGKTTLLRIAGGLEPLQSGSVELDGTEIAKPGNEIPPEKRPIGLVFQDYVLFPHLTVAKNIAFGLAGETDEKARVAEQLEHFNIKDLARRYPHELSGGQQQRVALARAMVRRPKALLLDEPFASIDVALRRRLRERLRRILKDQNAAVLLVTHDAEEALSLGDRVALMRAGEIIEVATPETLYQTPKTIEGAALFPGSQRISGNVKSGMFQSFLGPVPLNGASRDLNDGPATAVVRPDTLVAIFDPAGKFHVADTRFAGPGWLTRLETDEGAHLSVLMDARPDYATHMNVTVDWERAFIFGA